MKCITNQVNNEYVINKVIENQRLILSGVLNVYFSFAM